MLPLTRFKKGTKYPVDKIKTIKGQIQFMTESDIEGYNPGMFTGVKVYKIDGFKPEKFYTAVIDFDSSDIDILKQYVNEELQMNFDDMVVCKTGGKHNGYHLYFLTKNSFQSFTTIYKDKSIDFISKKGKKPARVLIEGSIVQGLYFMYQGKMDIYNFPLLPKKIIKEQGKMEDSLSKYQGSDLEINIKGETNNLIAWKYVINYGFYKTYGKMLKDIRIKKNFRCIFHKEEHPSAGLVYTKTGHILYRDFHTNESYSLVEVVYSIVKRYKIRKMTKNEISDFYSQFAKFMKNFNIKYVINKVDLQEADPRFEKLLQYVQETKASHEILEQDEVLLTNTYLTKRFHDDGIKISRNTVISMVNILKASGYIIDTDKYITRQNRRIYFKHISSKISDLMQKIIRVILKYPEILISFKNAIKDVSENDLFIELKNFYDKHQLEKLLI